MSVPDAYGWVRVTWRGKKRACVRCGAKRRRGIVGLAHVGREADPDFRFLCTDCDRELDREGEE